VGQHLPYRLSQLRVLRCEVCYACHDRIGYNLCNPGCCVREMDAVSGADIGTGNAPAGAVTLVFTDIQGYSELSERYRGAFRPVLEAHNRLLRTLCHQYNGYEVKALGMPSFSPLAGWSKRYASLWRHSALF
jgi:hypothetical protein